MCLSLGYEVGNGLFSLRAVAILFFYGLFSTAVVLT